MAVAAIGGAILAVLRVRPVFGADASVFVAMFDALLDGEAMYADAFDHKDPVFYGLGAVEMALFGTRGHFVAEILLLSCLGGLGAAAATHAGVDCILATALGVATVGAVTHPVVYRPGLTSVPAIVLLALILVLVQRRSTVAAGLASGLLFGLKLGYAPLVLPFLVLVMIAWTVPERKKYLAAAAGTVLVTAAVLALRGEFGGYIDSVRVNVGYVRIALDEADQSTAPLGTLQRLGSTVGSSTYLLVLLVVAAAGLLAIGRFVQSTRHEHVLVAVLSSAIVAGLLAATYLHQHHLQLVAWTVLLLGSVALAGRQHWSHKVRIALGVVLVGVMMGPFTADLRALPDLRQQWALPAADDPSRELANELRELGVTWAIGSEKWPVDVAIVASNTTNPAPWMADRLHVVCPDFYQRPWFGDRLQEHVDCIATKPQYVIDVQGTWDDGERLSAYRVRVDEVLEERFVQRDIRLSNGDLVRLWSRTTDSDG